MKRYPTITSLPLLLLAPLAGLLTGCATYEYDLVRPDANAGHIGSKDWKSVSVDDIEYRMKSSNNRLVIDAFNRTEETIKLIGDDSVAVDPKGESHPLKSRTIPPGSYVRLILPPPPPQIRRSGASFGFGFGAFGGGYRRREFGYGAFDDFGDTGPAYYAVYDYSDVTLWTWDGDRTDAKLILKFERGKESVQHEFLFRRIKQ